MPSDAPQATRKAQLKRRKRPRIKAPTPTPTQVRNARQQARTYVSQGKAVEKVATKRVRAQKTRQHETKDVKSNADLTRGAKERDKNVRTARIKYLRRTRKPVTTLKKELEGKGLLAKGLSSIAKNAGYVSTGGGPNVGTAAGRKATSGSFAPRGSAAITVPRVVSGKEAKGVGRFAQDIVNFPAQAIPSVYVPAAGLVEAAKGRPQRIKKFAKDIEKTDPVYNTVKAGAEAATGNSKAARKDIREAGKAASEHPGFTALEAAGAKGAVGRGAGRVMRTGAVGAKAKRVAATRGEPKTLEGTKITAPRKYSPDVTTKARQVVVEKSRRRKTAKIRKEADRVHSREPEQAETLRARANRIDPDRVSDSEIKRRVDEQEAAREDVRRIHRAQVTAATRKAVKIVPRKSRSLVSLVAQRIVRPDVKDIKAYVRELEAEHPNLDKAGKRANLQMRRDIKRALDHGVDPEKLSAASDAYAKVVHPLEQKLIDRGLLDSEQAARSARIPYAVRRMNAEHVMEWEKGQKYPKRRLMVATAKKHEYELAQKEVADLKLDYAEAKADPSILDADKYVGDKLKAATEKRDQLKAEAYRELPTEEIGKHMAVHGEGDPVYLSQAPSQRGARNFNIRHERAPGISSFRRTGQATKRGTFDIHPQRLEEGAARSQGLADASDGWTGLLDEFGVRKPKTGRLHTFHSWTRAQKAAANASVGGVKYRAVRAIPFHGHEQQLHALLEEADSADQLTNVGSEKSPVLNALEDALKGGGEGPWVLIPDVAARRLQEHLSATGTGTAAKTQQLVNSAFRKTVLSMSPSWAAGNLVEASLRSALNHVGPRSYITGRVLRKGMSAEDLARSVGGGHYSLADRAHIRRSAEQFAGTKLEPIANALGKFWRTPGPKYAAGAWHLWTNMVFEGMRRIESEFQTAMLGKAARDTIMSDRLVKLSKQALDEAAEGVKDRNTVVELGREVDRMYGRYSKRSPSERQLVAYYTPFIAWYLNSIYFLTRHLPRDHPVVTGLIAQAELATDDWRKAHGLDFFLPKGKLPAWLQGTIPVGGSKYTIGHYTPFGLASDPGMTTAGQVLPQYKGPLLALMGLDWKGDKLKGKDGKDLEYPGTIPKAFAAFADATVPALSRGQQVAKKGPGALNPFKPIPPYAPKIRRSAARSSSGIRWSDQGSGVKWDDQQSGVKWGG